MAKLVVCKGNFRLWALTKAEDHILIDALLRIERYVPKSDTEFFEFEQRCFTRGDMLSDKSLMMLNSILNRKGYDVLHLREGHSDSYTILNGHLKAQERVRIRDMLAGLSPDQRTLVIKSKKDEVAQQHDRDAVYDARKSARLTRLVPHGMSKVAPTALTEQLTAALVDGRLASPTTDAIAIDSSCTKPVSNTQRADSAKPRLLRSIDQLDGYTGGDTPSPQADTPRRLGTVELAMLAEVKNDVCVLRGEMSALNAVHAENGALHAAVVEIDHLKQVVAANQDEMRALRAALRGFQAAFVEIAIAA